MNMKEAFGVLSFFDSLAEKYKMPIHKLNLHVDEIGDLQVSEYNGDTFKSLDIICRTELTREQRIANLLEHVEKELEQICGEKLPFDIRCEIDMPRLYQEATPNMEFSQYGAKMSHGSSAIYFTDKNSLPF